jgi:TPR repeat protein
MQPAAARLPADELAALLARGDTLFGNRDITSARLFYERGAEGGDAQAALRLGETYDAAFLDKAGLRGVHGDPAAAARWYWRAHALGAADAEILLSLLASVGDATIGGR